MLRLLLSCLCLLPMSVLACGLEQSRQLALPGEGELYLRFEQEPTVDRFLVAQLRFCRGGDALDAELSRLLATMPAHGHGMNYQAQLQRLGPGHYEAEGLLFHMTGTWRLALEFSVDGERQQLQTDYEL